MNNQLTPEILSEMSIRQFDELEKMVVKERAKRIYEKKREDDLIKIAQGNFLSVDGREGYSDRQVTGQPEKK